jgi:tRNA pseudouridine55 synthase
VSMLKNFHEGEILLVNKPLTWTSFDVVNKIKYATRAKVGHAGTLDPLATGLMIICTGKFTKKLTDFSGLDKCYEGKIYLGATTPTYDSELEPDAIFDITNITKEDILQAVQKLTGNIEQIPPIYSAIKKDGKKAYEQARKGKDVKMEPRKVTIHQFDIKKINLPEIDFFVSCSKGTYIRSLAYDLGKLLQNGAYLKSLNRTQIGSYQLKDAWQLDDLINYIKEHPELCIKPENNNAKNK